MCQCFIYQQQILPTVSQSTTRNHTYFKASESGEVHLRKGRTALQLMFSQRLWTSLNRFVDSVPGGSLGKSHETNDTENSYHIRFYTRYCTSFQQMMCSFKLKKKKASWRNGSVVKHICYLAEDEGWGPNTHIRQLTTAYNSSFKESSSSL